MASLHDALICLPYGSGPVSGAGEMPGGLAWILPVLPRRQQRHTFPLASSEPSLAGRTWSCGPASDVTERKEG